MKNRIYLAGGLRSNWQQRIIREYQDDFIFFNPIEHGLESSSKEYTTWDLHFLEKSDIVFAYLEENNPSGIGLALEVGFAKAKGKTIILVDERSSTDKRFERYFRIVHECSSVTFYSIEKGMSYLGRFATNKPLPISR